MAPVTRPSPQTDRVATLIELLATEGTTSMTLAEVTRRLGVNKSSCHSVLTALLERGWVTRDPASLAYRLGPALIAVGRRAAEGFPALELARPVMDEFAHRFGVHCVALGIAGDRGTLVGQVRDLRSTSTELPMTDIALRPPLGTVIYAYEDEATVDQWLEGEPPDAQRHHRAVLELTRRRHYSVELATPPETRLRNLVAQLREDLTRQATSPGTEGDADAGRRGEDSIGQMVDRLAGELASMERFEHFLPLRLDPDGEYLVSSLSAPVFDRSGRVALTLSLLGFPGLVSGALIDRTGAELAEATAGITRQAGGTVPAGERLGTSMPG
jgi:DNA-binding IclR family transcriptional regulator